MIKKNINKKFLGSILFNKSIWRNIDVKTWVFLKKMAGKIHPSGYHYTEKFEYCIRHRDMAACLRWIDVKTWVFLKKVAGKIHPAGYHCAETFEHCIRHRDVAACVRWIDVKTWVFLKKMTGKIHPSGCYYTEKIEYCIRHRDMGAVRRFVAGLTWKLNSGTMRLLRRFNLFRLFSPSPLQNEQPLVSVVIPCFNYGQFVEEAIDSVLAQTLNNLEIIVVEGGSTDGFTRPLLESLDKPKTTILFQNTPTLVGENRNLGIQHAKGRYICCLDADDLILPTYLEKAVYLLETYDYDIVSTAYVTFGEMQTTFGVLAVPTLREMLEGNQIITCAVFRRDRWASTASGFVDSGRGADHVAELRRVQGRT